MNEPRNQVPQVLVQDLLQVTIPNWKKFNPRSDRVNFSWFRMENRFFEDQSIFHLNDQQKILYMFILCTASKGNNETFEIRTSYASALLRRDENSVRIDFFFIAKLKLIQITELDSPQVNLDGGGTMPTECRQNDGSLTSKWHTTRRDVTRRVSIGLSKDNPEHIGLDFEALYKNYPARKGSQRKAQALQVCKTKFNSPESYALLEKAIVNYAEHCKQSEKTGTEFVSQFKTFVSNLWEEWINPAVTYQRPRLIMERTGGQNE